jgi:YHS domain-containing protein
VILERPVNRALRLLTFIGVLLAAAGCTLNDRLLETVRDPVCGARVEKKAATVTRTLLRKAYYFDSEECARTFDAHPARWCDLASTMYPEYDY